MSVNDQRTAPAEVEFEVQEGEDETAATFIFGNEDHTLGNALRHSLTQLTETDFAGYSVPHPYEPKMNLRLQTRGQPVLEVLKQGLTNLGETAVIIDERFIEALKEFEVNHNSASAGGRPAGAAKKSKKR